MVGHSSLVVLFGAIFVGFPIAFTLISVALCFGYVALGDLALYLMTTAVLRRHDAIRRSRRCRSSCSWATCSSNPG